MPLISDGSSAISAIPPALSVIGPNASNATIIPVRESMEVAAMAIPYSPCSVFSEPPANMKEPQILKHTARTGRAVAFIETPNPAIIFVACPVVDASAIFCTGLYSVLV